MGFCAIVFFIQLFIVYVSLGFYLYLNYYLSQRETEREVAVFVVSSAFLLFRLTSYTIREVPGGRFDREHADVFNHCQQSSVDVDAAAFMAMSPKTISSNAVKVVICYPLKRRTKTT